MVMFGIRYRSVERMVDTVYVILIILSVLGGRQKPRSGSEWSGKVR